MKHFKFLTTLALVLMAGIAMCSQLDWLTVQSFTSILPHAGNITEAVVGTVVANGILTQQAVTDPTGVGTASEPLGEGLDIADIEAKVQLYKPYQTPILSYLSQNGVATTSSYKKEYYAIDARGMDTTIVAVDTTLTSHVIILEVADASIFTDYNLVFFTEITTATTKVGSGRYLVGIITDFPSTNHITVKLLNYGNANADADFTNGMAIYRGPTAANESSASTSPWGGYPEMDYNFTQFFQEQVQMSELQQLNKKAVEWNFGDVKRMAIEDFKLQKERAHLAGYRNEFTTTVGGKVNRHYTTGGFLNDPEIPYLASQTLSGLGSDTVTGWLKSIYAGVNGSPNKLLLAGCDMTEAIERIKSDNKWMTAKESSVVLGVDIVKAVSTFGTLDIMYYEQLDLLGYPKMGLVIDPAFIKPCTLAGKGFTVRDLDLKKAGISSDQASVIEEWVTMLIMNKKSHHIIQGV